MSHSKKEDHNLSSYKMTAQSIGLIVCAFFLFFLAGKGFSDILKGTDGDPMVFMPLLLLPVAGYILTWYKESLGAFIMVAGGLLLFIYVHFMMRFNIGSAILYSLPFIVSGILFMLHISKKKKFLKNKH